MLEDIDWLKTAEPQARRRIEIGAQLARFRWEGEGLFKKIGRLRPPLPHDDVQAWIGRLDTYVEDHLGIGYLARLNDFSGMNFQSGSDAERAKLRNAVDGRIRRLLEFFVEIK